MPSREYNRLKLGEAKLMKNSQTIMVGEHRRAATRALQKQQTVYEDELKRISRERLCCDAEFQRSVSKLENERASIAKSTGHLDLPPLNAFGDLESCVEMVRRMVHNDAKSIRIPSNSFGASSRRNSLK